MSKIYYLRDLLEIKNGKDYKHLNTGNIPVYGTGGIMTYVDEYLFDGESILLPRKGTLNNICYVNDKFWTVDTMYWSTINWKIVYPKYLFCYLSLLDLSSRDSGSTLPSMTFDSYYSIPINIPEMDIQKKIGDLYFEIDNKINKNNEINSELESMAKTIYDYWFLQFEFPNEEGKPYKSSGGKMVWNEKLKRKIPEGWEEKKLGDIFQFIKGKIPEKIEQQNGYNLVRYLTIDTVNGGSPSYCSKDSMILTNGDVLMVMDGAASSEVYVGNNGAIGSTFCKLDIKDKTISNELLFLIMRTLEKVLKKVNTGSTVPHANKNYINNFHIALPINNNTLQAMQKSIILYINKISTNKAENRQLSSLRDFLLPLLMNGQVGFKDEIKEKDIDKEAKVTI